MLSHEAVRSAAASFYSLKLSCPLPVEGNPRASNRITVMRYSSPRPGSLWR